MVTQSNSVVVEAAQQQPTAEDGAASAFSRQSGDASSSAPAASTLFRKVASRSSRQHAEQKEEHAAEQRPRKGKDKGGPAKAKAGKPHAAEAEVSADPDSLPQQQQGGGRRILKISPSTRAGQAAAHLSHILREQESATVEFSNSRGILKTLKALAIAHQFLGQHGSALSFVPCGYEVLRPPTADATSDYLDAWRMEEMYDDPEEEPGPREVFTLDVWRRRSYPYEVDVRPGRGPPLYDFSLDARRDWKFKAAVSKDMSYSLADMLYGQLVQKPANEGQALPSMERMQRRQYQGTEWSGPVLLSADMAQAVTIFMALTLFQQRLQQEAQPLEVGCA
jgi:stage V sporulation protein SpoVS